MLKSLKPNLIILGVVGLILVIAFNIHSNQKVEAQANSTKLIGYAWSENIGWISFSSENVQATEPETAPLSVPCTPDSPLTQTLACPSGQTGEITQERTSTCPGPVTSEWVTTSDTCTVVIGYCDNDGDGYFATTKGSACTGAQQATPGNDCNDTCTTCFPGSTSYTTSADGLDQDCSGTVDNTTAGATNIRQLVSPAYEVGGYQSCTQLCASYTQSCTNIGNDAGATNGAYWQGCPGGGSSCWNAGGGCGTGLGGQWGYCACAGFHAPWTNCKCQTLQYH